MIHTKRISKKQKPNIHQALLLSKSVGSVFILNSIFTVFHTLSASYSQVKRLIPCSLKSKQACTHTQTDTPDDDEIHKKRPKTKENENARVRTTCSYCKCKPWQIFKTLFAPINRMVSFFFYFLSLSPSDAHSTIVHQHWHFVVACARLSLKTFKFVYH